MSMGGWRSLLFCELGSPLLFVFWEGQEAGGKGWAVLCVGWMNGCAWGGELAVFSRRRYSMCTDVFVEL